MSQEEQEVTSMVEGGQGESFKPKEPYRVTFTFHPPENNPTLSPQPIDVISRSNIQRKKFEYESCRLQETSREELSCQRKSARQKKVLEKREEEMSTNEMFERLMN